MRISEYLYNYVKRGSRVWELATVRNWLSTLPGVMAEMMYGPPAAGRTPMAASADSEAPVCESVRGTLSRHREGHEAETGEDSERCDDHDHRVVRNKHADAHEGHLALNRL